MTFITTENRVVHFAKHRDSRVYVFNCLPRPQAAQGTSKTDCRGQMGGSPKALATASGRGNQPAGDYRSPTVVARVPMTS